MRGQGTDVSTQSWSVSRRGRTRFNVVRRRPSRGRYAEPDNGSGRGGSGGERSFRATLRGVNQVPPVLTNGTGSFRATISRDGTFIDYELTYSGLTTPAGVAHIHFGHPTDNGGIMAFLCGGGDAPACPGAGGTVTGRIEADDILAIPEQGLAAGDLASTIRLMRAGLVYVNVHTPTFPDGEIRGQVQS